MGGYAASGEYATKQAFWSKHYRDRYPVWDRFIRKHATKNMRLLSIASGRGINELRLLEDGYQVRCSDLAVPDCHTAACELFGPLESLALNILDAPPVDRYDGIICLSLIYLFDHAALDAFFRNVAAALPVGGRLVLDGAGSEPTVLSTLFLRVFLKWEAWAQYLIRKAASATPLSRFLYTLWEQQAGYRWKRREIIDAAARHDLRLVAHEEHDPVSELNRSPLLAKIVAHPEGLAARLLVAALGNRMKYLRLFAFEKTTPQARQ